MQAIPVCRSATRWASRPPDGIWIERTGTNEEQTAVAGVLSNSLTASVSMGHPSGSYVTRKTRAWHVAQKLADIINTAGASVAGRFDPDQSGVIHAQAWASGPSTGGITITFVLASGTTSRYGKLGNLDRVFLAHGRTLGGVPVGSGQGFQWSAGNGASLLFANGNNNTKYHVTLDFTQTLLDKNGVLVPMSNCRKMYMVFAPRFENVEQDLQDGCFLAAGVGTSDTTWTVDDSSKLTGGRYFIGTPTSEERIQLLSVISSTQITVARGFEASTPSAWSTGARLKKLSPLSGFNGDVEWGCTLNCTVNPGTARVFRVGDFVVFNDEAADASHAGRRSHECVQIVGPGNTGDVVPTGSFQFQRAYPGVPTSQATFGTLRCAHLAAVKFYKLDMKLFTFAVKKGFFRTPGLPPRVEAKIPSVCVVAALVGVANHFGYGPFTVFPQSHHNEPFMPGDRTCSGGAYTFQIPGSLAAQDNVAIPLKVQNAASIRCVYAYLQQGTSDGQSAYVVKYSTDGGATWNVLEKMGIAQSIPTAFKNTWDFLVGQGYGKPETRRLPYDDYGLVTIAAITGSGVAQAVATASYDGSTSGLVPGDFVFLELGLANEEHVNVISVDTVNQTFTAIVTKNHPAGSSIRPSIWPTAVLLEGNDLAFDIKAVASPDSGSDLTVVIQT